MVVGDPIVDGVVGGWCSVPPRRNHSRGVSGSDVMCGRGHVRSLRVVVVVVELCFGF